jgi:hypothetical protein
VKLVSKFQIFYQNPTSYPNISLPRPNKKFQYPTFTHLSSASRMQYAIAKKIAKNADFSRLFSWNNFFFLGSRWNISTNETVLERLLNFWNFETYTMYNILMYNIHWEFFSTADIDYWFTLRVWNSLILGHPNIHGNTFLKDFFSIVWFDHVYTFGKKSSQKNYISIYLSITSPGNEWLKKILLPFEKCIKYSHEIN